MIGVVIGAALFVVLSSGLFVDQMRRNIERQVTADQAAVAQAYAGLVDEYLTGAKAAADAMAEQPVFRTPLQVDKIQPDLKGLPADADP